MMWDDDGGRWQMMDRGPGWAALVLLVLVTVVVTAPLVAFVTAHVLGHRAGNGSSSPADPADQVDPAGQLVRERFARGEIDEDDYQSRLATLRKR